MEVLENIISKLVLFVLILLTVGVFILVWGVIYEEMGSVTISSVIKHEELTPLYIFEQSPYGLLLGWIPAYFASIVFLTILEILLPMIMLLLPLLTVILLWMWA